MLLPAAAIVPAEAAGSPFGIQLRATAITKVFGDGQKLIALALEYPSPLQDHGLSPADFQVAQRTITGVYTSDAMVPGQAKASGRYVIVELSPDDPGALLISSPFGAGPGGGRPTTGPPQGADARDGQGPPDHGPGTGGPGMHGGGPPGGFPSPTLKVASATVLQVRPLTATDGAVYPATHTGVTTTVVKNLIVDEFRQHTYSDPHGGTLRYNLFVPHGYDPAKRYPLVLFVHDAGTLSTNPLVTLAQGLGAVIWASPEDQARRPCFVLAPQFSSVAEGEQRGPGSPMDQIFVLIGSLATQYSIDTKRLYSTGQSMGAMLSIAMNIAHPGFFAASFLVAGQWDAEQASPLAKDKLWIVVSEGDTRAFPGENAMVAVWEKEGARVSKAVWNGRATAAEFAEDVRRMEATDTPIHYAAFRKGTVVPPTERDDMGSNHINTWRIAYTIEGIRAWLFQQHG